MAAARKAGLDRAGALALIGMALVFGMNNLLIRVLNEALQPAVSAGLRSVGAALCVGAWMVWRGQGPRVSAGTVPAGLLIGALFAAEFLCLFLALDRTTVVRSAVIFYSMPLWLALGAHLLIPGERLTRARMAGLAVALGGVALAFADRLGGAAAGLAGDLLALGAAVCWAGIVLVARSSALSRERPEMQLFWQLLVSGPLLLAAAPLFGGPFVRDFQPVDALWFAILTIGIASAGFLVWFRLLAVYPSWAVASFSFLTPLVAAGLGWAVLDEPVSPTIFAALAAVALGIVLINRPARPPARSAG